MGKGKSKKGKGKDPSSKPHHADEKPDGKEADKRKRSSVRLMVLKKTNTRETKGKGKEKGKHDDNKKSDAPEDKTLKRRIEIPALESSVAPIFGEQVLVLSDSFILSISAIRARGLLMSGTRSKHLQQSAIITVLLDCMTISCLRAKNVHLRGEFVHFGTNPEDSSVWPEVVDQFSMMRLSNASSVRSEMVGAVQAPSGDKLVTIGLPAVKPEMLGTEAANMLVWQQGELHQQVLLVEW